MLSLPPGGYNGGVRLTTIFLLSAALWSCAGSKPKTTADAGGGAYTPVDAAVADADIADPAGKSGAVVLDPAGAGVAGAAAPVAASRTVNDDPNRLKPGYAIRLTYAEDRDLNGTFRVEFDGTVSLPYNVRVRAEGLTIDELRKKLIETYKSYYKEKGGLALRVELAERAFLVELRGLIAKPGKYRIRPDSSVDEVIAMAGGFPQGAENQPRFLKISHPAEEERVVNLAEYYKSGSQRVSEHWHGGELLFFQKDPAISDVTPLESENVQVQGDLRHPGEFPFRAGADVYFYMTAAGGPTNSTDFEKVDIFRGPPGKRSVVEFDLEEPENVPLIRPGDILVFQGDKTSRTQKKLSIVTSIATIISTIALVIIAL